MDPAAAIKQKALEIGFDTAGITAARTGEREQARLRAFVEAGEQGDMDWMVRTLDRRADPQTLWPEARSVIVVTSNYGPAGDPMENLAATDRANISVYARNRDYHDLVKKRLKQLARWMVEAHGCDVKVFVDTAPVMEKPLAQSAGVGWQGKHSNLVSRDLGSWFFLGEVFTDMELPADAAEVDHCGSCQRCLDICPTNAFPTPYTLDARRCISYLTIEHKGHIAEEFRPAIGNRIYGCDDCLAVCPWNKYAQMTQEAAFTAREDLELPALGRFLGFDDAAFREFFSGSPIKRIGRDRFLRNVLIAAGNSAELALAIPIAGVLDDPSPLVRAMAIWALKQLCDAAGFAALHADFAASESDPSVRAEWG